MRGVLVGDPGLQAGKRAQLGAQARAQETDIGPGGGGIENRPEHRPVIPASGIGRQQLADRSEIADKTDPGPDGQQCPQQVAAVSAQLHQLLVQAAENGLWAEQPAPQATAQVGQQIEQGQARYCQCQQGRQLVGCKFDAQQVGMTAGQVKQYGRLAVD